MSKIVIITLTHFIVNLINCNNRFSRIAGYHTNMDIFHTALVYNLYQRKHYKSRWLIWSFHVAYLWFSFVYRLEGSKGFKSCLEICPSFLVLLFILLHHTRIFHNSKHIIELIASTKTYHAIGAFCCQLCLCKGHIYQIHLLFQVKKLLLAQDSSPV